MNRLQSALLFFLITGTKACTEDELRVMDIWLESQKLNSYGDPQDTMYAGGSPLFDESTGVMASRCDYLMGKFAAEPWNRDENDVVDIGIITKPPLNRDDTFDITATGGETLGENTNDVESPATKPPVTKPPVTKPPTEQENPEILPIGTGDETPVTKPPTEQENPEILPTGDGGGNGDGSGGGNGGGNANGDGSGGRDVNGLDDGDGVASSAPVATSALFLIGASLATSFFLN